MPPAPTAAPAAPAAAPAPAPVAPSAAPAPAPAPAAKSEPSGGSPGYVEKAPDADRQFTPGKFDDLDTLGDEPAAPAPKKESTEPAKPGDDPAPKKESAAPEPELDSDRVPKVKTNKELRQWAIKQRDSAEETQKKADKLEARIKELEANTGKTPQTEEMTKQLASLNSKVEEYETKLRFSNYQQSEEYRDKYEQPISSAIESAHNFMEELRVESTNSETGEVTSRKANAADFNRIYHLDRADAKKLSRELFGDDAADVMAHRAKIQELSKSAGEAMERYKKEGSEIEKQAALKSNGEREATGKMWREVNESLVKKHPQWFAPVEGDEEGNAALQKGYQLVDSALGENRSKLTMEQRIIADAHIRNRAAGFTRLVIHAKKLKAENAELQKTIEKMRGSGPGGRPSGGGGSGGGSGKAKTWEQDMDERFPE